jgi:hypothetical protein
MVPPALTRVLVFRLKIVLLLLFSSGASTVNPGILWNAAVASLGRQISRAMILVTWRNQDFPQIRRSTCLQCEQQIKVPPKNTWQEFTAASDADLEFVGHSWGKSTEAAIKILKLQQVAVSIIWKVNDRRPAQNHHHRLKFLAVFKVQTFDRSITD